MATDRPRYTVSVDKEMFEEIENFRFENRFATRSDATVELIRRGLDAFNAEKALADKRSQNSVPVDDGTNTAKSEMNTKKK